MSSTSSSANSLLSLTSEAEAALRLPRRPHSYSAVSRDRDAGDTDAQPLVTGRATASHGGKMNNRESLSFKLGYSLSLEGKHRSHMELPVRQPEAISNASVYCAGLPGRVTLSRSRHCHSLSITVTA